MQTIEPAPKTLFCKPGEAETTTRSGIILAGGYVIKPKTAKIINTGEGSKYKRDDVIVYKPYTTTEIKIDGDDYLLITEEDILGRVIEV